MFATDKSKHAKYNVPYWVTIHLKNDQKLH